MSDDPRPSGGGPAPLHRRLARMQRPIIVGVAGDSGSGKTTFSKGIRRLLGHDLVATLAMDDYHAEDRAARRRSGRLPLDPAANHLDLLARHLEALRAGESVEKPVYDHDTGRFAAPETFAPRPIVIVEGLHALYPEFKPLLDFRIYVDPAREVKFRWKHQRDVAERGHDEQALREEMMRREAAYKRWIDFQKTDAEVVIKLFPTEVGKLAWHTLAGPVPESHKIVLIVQTPRNPLPPLKLGIDMGALMGADEHVFQLATASSMYWGRPVNVIHIDGRLPQETVSGLERHLSHFTGVDVDTALPLRAHEQVPANLLASLLVAWRFIERVNGIIRREGEVAAPA